MDWLSFLGSILGGLIGGLFTFFGVKLTIKHDDKKKLQEQIEKTDREKPRLEIMSFKDFKNTPNINTINNDCNVVALEILDFKEIEGKACFFYNENALDNKNLTFVEYQFINNGLTENEEICVTSNLPRSMALTEFERKETYINEHILNYDAWCNKRYIKPKDTFKLRIYYVKDQIPTANFISPELVVWLRDVNGFVWKQILNAPTNEIEISRMSSRSEFKKSIDTEKAIECFKNPILW